MFVAVSLGLMDHRWTVLWIIVIVISLGHIACMRCRLLRCMIPDVCQSAYHASSCGFAVLNRLRSCLGWRPLGLKEHCVGRESRFPTQIWCRFCQITLATCCKSVHLYCTLQLLCHQHNSKAQLGSHHRTWRWSIRMDVMNLFSGGFNWYIAVYRTGTMQ